MERIVRPRLTVRDLELVQALAEAGSTTRAASLLHLSQSAVSRALVLMEETLGVPLFERRARGLVPTAAGQRLIDGVGPLLLQWAELEHKVAEPAQPARVRLVCECYTAYRWLPSTLQRLRAALPSIEVSVAIEHTERPVAALEAGEVDVALLTTSRAGAGMAELALFSDEVVCVMAASHALAARAAISARELMREPLLLSSATPDAERRWFQARLFGRSRPSLTLLRFPLTEAIMDAASAGMGVAVMSEWIAHPYVGRGDLVVRPLARGGLLRPWRMAFRPEVARVARQLATALRSAPPRVHAQMQAGA